MDSQQQRDAAEERYNAAELKAEGDDPRPTQLERCILDLVGANHLRALTIDYVRQSVDVSADFPPALMSTIEQGWIAASAGQLTITPAGRLAAGHDLFRHRRAAALAGSFSRALGETENLTVAERNEDYPARVDILARMITYLGEAALISGAFDLDKVRRTAQATNLTEASPEAMAPIVLLEEIGQILMVRARGTE